MPIQPTRLGGQDGQPAIFAGNSTGASAEPSLVLRENGVVEIAASGGGAVASPPDTIVTHEKQVVTVRRSGGNDFSLLVDGVEVASGTLANIPDVGWFSLGGPLGITGVAGDRGFRGWIGAPRIDMEYLTDDQVLAYVESEKQLDSIRTSSSGLVLDMPFGERASEVLKDEAPNGGYHGSTANFGNIIRAHQRTRIDRAEIDAEEDGQVVVRLHKGWDDTTGVGDLVREWTFDVTAGSNTVFFGEWLDPDDGDYWLGRHSGVRLQRTDTSNSPIHSDSLSALAGNQSTGGNQTTRYYYFFRLKATYIAPELTGDEQVTNGGFENWTGGEPDGWNTSNPSDYNVNEVTEGNLTAAEVETLSSNGGPGLNQTIEGLDAGQAYRLSFLVRVTDPTDAGSMRWQIWNSTDSADVIPLTSFDQTHTKPVRVDATFVALAGKTYQLRFGTASSATEGKFRITDVSLRKITASDRSEQGNHGELRAADNKEGPRLVDGPRPGVKAWEFNGVEADKQVIRVPSHASISPTQEITLSALVKTNNNDIVQGLLAKSDNNGNRRNYDLSLNTDGRALMRLRLDDNNVAVGSNTGVVPQGEWVRVTGTYDGVAMRVFVGKPAALVGESPGSGTIHAGNEPLVVGTLRGSGGPEELAFPLNGAISGHPKVYNRALTAAEVSILHRLGPEFLEALWEFDGDDEDTSGNGHHGEFIDGGPTWGEKGYKFGGNEVFSTTGGNYPDVGAGPWTLAARVKAPYVATHAVLYGTQPNLSLRTNGVNIQWEDADSVTRNVLGGSWGADTDVHIGATYDGATVRLYVNGEEVGSQAESNMKAQTSSFWRIGHWRHPETHPRLSSSAAEAEIWEVFISKRALSASAMKFLADNPGKFTHMPTPPADMITKASQGDSSAT